MRISEGRGGKVNVLSLYAPQEGVDHGRACNQNTLIGTPIPEPSKALLVALGLTVLVAKNPLRKPSNPYRLWLMQTRWKGGSEWQPR